MTGQDLLDAMEIFNAELQLQSGETDVSRGLLALNIAQDYFESLAAQRARVFGSQIGTVTTTASGESTAWPTGLLRLDRLQTINDSTNRPDGELSPVKRVGGQVAAAMWPYNLLLSSQGKPRAYWTDGSNIYWSPVPDSTYTIRWYGFKSAADITAYGTFSYPDIVRLPLSGYATRILKGGIDDDPTTLAQMAQETFTSVLDQLGNFNRDGASGLEYTRPHLS